MNRTKGLLILIPALALTLGGCGGSGENTMNKSAEAEPGIKCANMKNEFRVFSDSAMKIFDEDNLYEQMLFGEYKLCGDSVSELSMGVVQGDDESPLKLQITVDGVSVSQSISEAGDVYLINLDYDDKYTEIAATDYSDPHSKITFYRYNGSEILMLGSIDASWSAPDYRRAEDLSLCEGSLYSDGKGRLITGADFEDYSDSPALSGYWEVSGDKLNHWNL